MKKNNTLILILKVLAAIAGAALTVLGADSCTD